MADLTRPIKPRVVVTAATLVSVMNGWRAGGMRRVHDCGVSCVIRGVSGALAGSSSEVSDGDVTLGWAWDSADRVFGPYGMNQQWPTSPARSSHAVVTAATLVSVMNGWHAGGMRRVHDFGVSCLIRGVSGALADSQIPKFRTEM